MSTRPKRIVRSIQAGRGCMTSLPLSSQSSRRVPPSSSQPGELFPETTRLAVTMTAELADCFVTKAEGMSYILDQLESIGRSVSVWSTSGQFVSGEEARQQPMLVAAANWHALA